MPSTATAPTATPADPATHPAPAADPSAVHPRPEHCGLVVTGASRWPWYEEPADPTPTG
jgi:hypothetical protein